MDAATTELVSHPLFSDMSDAAQRDLAAAAVRRRVRRLELVYSPGSPSDAAFLVRRGRVKISRLSPDGREITLCLCHPGELFGEESLGDGGPRPCQAQALEESSLLILPAPVLQRLIQQEPALAVGFVLLISQRREEVGDQVEDLAFRDVGGRLARLLMSLATRQGMPAENRIITLNTRLTHQELANCVGTTRETLTLTIDRFKADGWIRFEGRMIVICDSKALSARAGTMRLLRGDG